MGNRSKDDSVIKKRPPVGSGEAAQSLTVLCFQIEI